VVIYTIPTLLLLDAFTKSMRNTTSSTTTPVHYSSTIHLTAVDKHVYRETEKFFGGIQYLP